MKSLLMYFLFIISCIILFGFHIIEVIIRLVLILPVSFIKGEPISICDATYVWGLKEFIWFILIFKNDEEYYR